MFFHCSHEDLFLTEVAEHSPALARIFHMKIHIFPGINKNIIIVLLYFYNVSDIQYKAAFEFHKNTVLISFRRNTHFLQ